MTTPYDLFSEHCYGIKKGSGDNWVCYCPIHETPGASSRSFSFNGVTGQWICFAGCGQGGPRSFLTELNVPRKDKIIALKNLKNVSTITPKRVRLNRQEPEETFTIPEKVLGLFDFSPDELIDKGFNEKLLRELDIGYDKKLSRITFPIRNIDGTLVGIMGRLKQVIHGKYKAYLHYDFRKMVPKTYTFKKGDHLWNANNVDVNIDEPLVLVEGFKAAVWVMQAGFEAVAMMGSKLTEEQAKHLIRIGRPIIFVPDNDNTGIKNLVRNTYKIKSKLKILTILYPKDTKQPDDIDLNTLKDLLNDPITIAQWRLKNNEQRSRK